jgi:hypothetical protein
LSTLSKVPSYKAKSKPFLPNPISAGGSRVQLRIFLVPFGLFRDHFWHHLHFHELIAVERALRKDGAPRWRRRALTDCVAVAQLPLVNSLAFDSLRPRLGHGYRDRDWPFIAFPRE